MARSDPLTGAAQVLFCFGLFPDVLRPSRPAPTATDPTGSAAPRPRRRRASRASATDPTDEAPAASAAPNPARRRASRPSATNSSNDAPPSSAAPNPPHRSSLRAGATDSTSKAPAGSSPSSPPCRPVPRASVCASTIALIRFCLGLPAAIIGCAIRCVKARAGLNLYQLLPSRVAPPC